MSENYNIVAEGNTETVVANYEPKGARRQNYQSEAELERSFIEQLRSQSYEYLDVKESSSLLLNLRHQIERLNDYKFSEAEWEWFFGEHIAKSGAGIVEKTRSIQEDPVKILKRDDGSFKNIKLIDKANVHNNSLQVINQYEANSGARKNRYDVTILVNGLPLVHVELKRRGVELKEAFNQINRYGRDSFWSDDGLFDYVQLFVISNGTNTKYYSNTTREGHIREMYGSGSTRRKKTSDSFEFTSFWADQNNKPLRDLADFTATFLSKHTILNILTKYCVFDVNQKLLVMRPYQIVATEKILRRILVSTLNRKLGTRDAGGYIWHTTGSGKTLTSFKTAVLASQMPDVDKVLFVVDRKDLDYQTQKEYDRFEPGAASASASTDKLKKNLDDLDKKIVITTIQKLDIFIGKYGVGADKNSRHEIFDKHVVMIFDECHRGQFGDTHKRITKAFCNYNIFGFTGTPIFATNAQMSSKHFDLTTTEQAFGDKLHVYSIVDAINDKNVLPFKVDYVKTVAAAENLADGQVKAIDTEAALTSNGRVRAVTEYILEHFDQKTKRNETYGLKERRLRGFNSIFAVQSIDLAKKYYDEFRRQQAGEAEPLKVATIFSFAANGDDPTEEIDGMLADEDFDPSALDKTDADFLAGAMDDYNAMFSTSYSLNNFENYYKDVSQKMKEREIDILIVVGMFLTGFDATTLNTLWVDKNLKYHGLLQAFSRTNRILNSIKTHGNIVCFRDLEERTRDAISLFGNEDACGIVLIKTYDEYYHGYEENGKRVKGYEELIAELTQRYPIDGQIIGEENQKQFIKTYGNILKLKNILSSFDEFSGNEILSDFDYQDYQSRYLDLYHEWRPKLDEKTNVNDDVVFEIELIKQVEINIDYILDLVKKYFAKNQEDKEILISINKAIDSSLDLRSKKDLINQFIARVNPNGDDIDTQWHDHVSEERESELNNIVSSEGLEPAKTKKFIDRAFRDGYIQETGTDLVNILPATSLFATESARSQQSKLKRVLEKLTSFFEKFRSIS